MKKAVVIFSGGQDSTTCLYWALSRYDIVEAITFNYGQKHSVELDCAKTICNSEGVKQTVIDISFLGTLVESALTSNGDVNKLNDKGLPDSFVPNRNQLFITLAHAYAQKIGAETLVTGTCETDFSGYFDCRRTFINEIEKTSNIGSSGHSLTPEWIAGFIDGEGSFSRSSYETKAGKVYYPTFSVEQADEGILNQIQAFFGAGTVTKRKKNENSLGKLDTWEFRLSYAKCEYVANLMRKYGANGRGKEKFEKWVSDHESFLGREANGDISANMANIGLIKIETPLMYLDKAETFELAEKEGCLGFVIAESHTCYNGDRDKFHDWGYGCDDCPACELRKKGYEEFLAKKAK